ncbi:pyridoxal 4-dehydrogenase [Kaistia algarum]|uniref:aldo/keto reductase n=1 Tax=Kaistia algarum TaxID=2083279 RepID=UPI000CE7C7C3|nr:aldo/keto reductase [Kaistia algarum]MCX5513131.1 aldo/keto reductase [Kaistia algarum]PPE82000.1 pyridoxal 4-dehydrogenase [Kaistia algarum]
MQTRKIGHTGLGVTTISFGCAGIGNLYRAVAREDAEATLALAWDAGIRYFDTAPRYGHGLSERRLGDFLQHKPAGSYVVSTKVGRLLKPVPANEVPDYGFVDPLPFRADYDYSYDGVMRSLEFSLARLGLNKVEIVFVHDIGVLEHGVEGNARHFRDLMDGGMKALDELKSAGVIRAVGLGVNEVEVCLETMARTPIDCILLAGRYTLLDRTAEKELLARCAETGTSLIVGGVFNSGILAMGAKPGAPFNYEPASETVLEHVRGLEAVAQKYGVSLGAAAMEFPLKSESVASVLIGTAKPSSLERNLDLLGESIPDAAWAEFEAHTLRQ